MPLPPQKATVFSLNLHIWTPPGRSGCRWKKINRVFAIRCRRFRFGPPMVADGRRSKAPENQTGTPGEVRRRPSRERRLIPGHFPSALLSGAAPSAHKDLLIFIPARVAEGVGHPQGIPRNI